MNKIKEFLDTLRSDPRVKELAGKMKKPENERDTTESYVKLANSLGYHITGEEILEELKNREQEQRARTEQAAKEAGKEGLREEDLGHIAGGEKGDIYLDDCASTFKEGEWCWFSDSCDYLINDYSDDGKEFTVPDLKQEGSASDIWDNLYTDTDGAREFIYGPDAD